MKYGSQLTGGIVIEPSGTSYIQYIRELGVCINIYEWLILWLNNLVGVVTLIVTVTLAGGPGHFGWRCNTGAVTSCGNWSPW